eukprot:2348203-Rhodomonas_salina.1
MLHGTAPLLPPSSTPPATPVPACSQPCSLPVCGEREGGGERGGEGAPEEVVVYARQQEPPEHAVACTHTQPRPVSRGTAHSPRLALLSSASRMAWSGESSGASSSDMALDELEA